MSTTSMAIFANPLFATYSVYARNTSVVFNLTDMNPEDFFTFANSNHNTRGHAYKLLPSRVDVLKGFFAVRIVKPWNCLPAELHHFSSLSVF